jgi:hypothetical protein
MNRNWDLRNPIIKKGYLYAIFSSLIFGILNGFKYPVFLKEHPTNRDIKIALLSSATLFVVFLIPSLLVARWYYELKSKRNTK